MQQAAAVHFRFTLLSQPVAVLDISWNGQQCPNWRSMLRGQLVNEVGVLRSRTAPDRDIFLAPTANAHIPYYRPKASAITT